MKNKKNKRNKHKKKEKADFHITTTHGTFKQQQYRKKGHEISGVSPTPSASPMGSGINTPISSVNHRAGSRGSGTGSGSHVQQQPRPHMTGQPGKQITHQRMAMMDNKSIQIDDSDSDHDNNENKTKTDKKTNHSGAAVKRNVSGSQLVTEEDYERNSSTRLVAGTIKKQSSRDITVSKSVRATNANISNIINGFGDKNGILQKNKSRIRISVTEFHDQNQRLGSKTHLNLASLWEGNGNHDTIHEDTGTIIRDNGTIHENTEHTENTALTNITKEPMAMQRTGTDTLTSTMHMKLSPGDSSNNYSANYSSTGTHQVDQHARQSTTLASISRAQINMLQKAQQLKKSRTSTTTTNTVASSTTKEEYRYVHI